LISSADLSRRKMTDPKHLPTYTNEEVASILTRALERQHDGGRISHDELLETAREIGVTTLEIEAAVTAEVKARAERLVLEEARARAVRRFAQHLAAFVVTNAILAVVDLKLTGGVFFYWIGLAWGAALAVHGARALAPIRELAATPKPAAATPTRIEVRGGKMELRADNDAANETRDQSSVRRRASG
jgi:hypothetical protein